MVTRLVVIVENLRVSAILFDVVLAGANCVSIGLVRVWSRIRLTRGVSRLDGLA